MNNNSKRFPHISRRQMIKTGGVLTGAVAATGLFASGGVRQLLALERPLQVGLLVPSSSFYPQLGENLAAGLQLYFNQQTERTVKLESKPIGFGPALAARQARELVEKGQVEVVVGVMGANVAAEIGDIFVSGRVPLIVSSVGTQAPRPEDWNPFTFHNSLNYWQANLAMGEWAAQHLGRRAFVAGSFYESGYDAFNAFRVGFERAGGQLAGKRVTHIRPEDVGLAQLMDEIEQARPDLVFATYSGREAAEFVQAFAAAGLAGRIPLAASAFTVDDHLLAELGDAAAGIWSCFSWSSALASDENQLFVNSFENVTGRPVDPFALLGYDAGRLIARLAEATNGELRRADQLQLVWGQLDGSSPRGALAVGDATLGVVSPLYLRQVQKQHGRLVNVVVDQLPGSPAPTDEMRVKSGWLNPYLCA